MHMKKSYIALLRGINVGGRTIKMADLGRCFADLGFENVKTVLQTGNVLFRADDQSLANQLSRLRSLDRTAAFEAEMNRNVEALTPEQVGAALRKYIDPDKLFVVTAGAFKTNPPPTIIP